MSGLSDEIDALCARYLRDNGPGFALAVMQNGELVARKTYGLANLEHDVPIKSDTVFEAASVSKQFTAFAVHLLIEDGTLSLDDDVRDHVPDLPDFGTPITVRHCLHHTCGYREWGDAMGFGGRLREDVWEPELVYRWLKKQQALNHPPGEEHLYSNTGYFVLAAVVTAASGMSFAAFCQERIFDPLGMSNTHFRERLEAIIKNQAASYYREDDGPFVPCLSNQALPGATSLQTTIDDMVLWLENFETGRVGGRNLLDAMHQPGVLNNGKPFKYGSGLEFSTYRGEEAVWHTGGWAAYASLTLRLPARRLAVAVLANTSELNTHDFWPDLVDLFLEPRSDDVGGAVRETLRDPLTGSLSDFAGLYTGPGGPVIKVEEREGALGIGGVHGESVALVAMGGLRFHPAGRSQVVIEFSRDETGRIAQYISTTDGHEQPPRVRIEPVAGWVDLTAYVGMYFSTELDIAYTISVKEGVLSVGSIVFGEEPLKQVGADYFMEAEGGPSHEVYRFERDAAGQVIAVLIGNSDARDQRFDLMRG